MKAAPVPAAELAQPGDMARLRPNMVPNLWRQDKAGATAFNQLEPTELVLVMVVNVNMALVICERVTGWCYVQSLEVVAKR